MKFAYRRAIVAIHDMLMIVVAWSLAYLSLDNFAIFSFNWSPVWITLPVVFACQAVVLWQTGCYRGLWRYASLPDLVNIVRAAVIGLLGVTLALALLNRLGGVPRAVLIFYPLWLVFCLSATRILYRIWHERSLSMNPLTDRKRVVIVGGGRAGEMLVRDMLRDSRYQLMAILDDSIELMGAKVQGVPVTGQLDALPVVVRDYSADVVIIAMPSATREQMQHVVKLCEGLAIPFRTVPRMEDIVSGRHSITELREVAIEDLLGRDPVTLDWQAISKGLTGRSVLVSGGGGSIGSELCRQIAKLQPSKLIILDASEFSLYRIKGELRLVFPELILHGLLGDIRDRVTLDYVFEHYQPEAVFHAAAYKHVPLLETQAREAIANNVLGTREIALAADRHHCQTFVQVSTDKAVNPANVMGASKRLAEIFCQALNKRSQTNYITVRFGNVLDSAGSVVPLFRKQIADGGPVTVTHPEITRYFMTIPEASQLILEAAAMGNGGEIFVLQMGDPIKIRDLAEQMIRLTGKIPGNDIEIVYTGLRPGEKLYEELFYDREALQATPHEKIELARSCDADWEVLNQGIKTLKEMCAAYDQAGIVAELNRLVPEMQRCLNDGAQVVEELSSNVINLQAVKS